MPIFSIISSGEEQKVISLGRSGAMKKMMKAIEDVIKALRLNPQNQRTRGDTRGIWKNCAYALENFGYTVVFDRNLIILLLALFAAWTHDENMRVLAAKVIRKEVTDNTGQKITLGQALLNGDGESIYKLLNCSEFNEILKNMGVSTGCIAKILRRMRKITPWYLSASVGVAKTVKKALEKMTGIEYREEPSLTEAERQALSKAEYELDKVNKKTTSEKEELTALNEKMKTAKKAAKQEAEKPDEKKEHKEQPQKAIPGYLSASVGVAKTVKETIEKMTDIEYREEPSLTEAERQALSEAEYELDKVKEKITSKKKELTELNKEMKTAKKAAKQEAEKPDGKKEHKEQSQKAIPALEMAEKMIEDTLTYLGELSQSVDEKLNSVRNAAREEPALSSESKTSQGTKQALELAKQVDKQLDDATQKLNNHMMEIFSKQTGKSSPAVENVFLRGIVGTVKNAFGSAYKWLTRWKRK